MIYIQVADDGSGQLAQSAAGWLADWLAGLAGS